MVYSATPSSCAALTTPHPNTLPPCITGTSSCYSASHLTHSFVDCYGKRRTDAWMSNMVTVKMMTKTVKFKSCQMRFINTPMRINNFCVLLNLLKSWNLIKSNRKSKLANSQTNANLLQVSASHV